MKGVEKLTQNAVRAIKSAYDFAEAIKSPVLTTEHLFVGLLSVKEGIASKVLTAQQIDIDKTIEKIKGRIINNIRSSRAEISVGEDFKEALRSAFAIANTMKHVYVGTEHLLLGILSQPDLAFVKELREAGVSYEEVKRRISSFAQYPEGVLSEAEKGEDGKSVLDFLATNLTRMAKRGLLDPVLGRDKEIERTINILARRTKNNPIIVGEAGVGKTAIVEGLAQKIVQGEVSSVLMGYEIWSLDTAMIVAGSNVRGELEAKVLALIDEVEKRGNVILFIDEIHNILGAGGGPGGMSVATILKPALAKGQLHCIGATTTAEYSNDIEKDPALARRFQPVFIEELSVPDAIKILKGLKVVYESFHNVKIEDEAIEQAVRLAKRFITDRYLPDKAVDLIDEACARSRVGKLKYTPRYRSLMENLRKLYFQKERLLGAGKLDEAVKIRQAQEKATNEFEEYRKQTVKKWKGKQSVVTAEDIKKVISEWTGIPLETISTSESRRLLTLERRLKQRVVGQEHAVKSVVAAVKRARTGVTEEDRPLASLLFLGPTGVGKTELAKQLARELFGDMDSFVQLDMSEMMESHSVSKLIGSPPGYVGFDQGGQLTEKIWRRPYSVVLFDEIEKAHRDVLNVLLQVLEEGHLTDGRGRKVSFKNTVIIMTSNIGAQEISSDDELGFKVATKKTVKKQGLEEAYEEMRDKILAKLKEDFRPEFLNRIDEIVIFKALSEEEVKKIVGIQVIDLNERLAEKGLTVEITPALQQRITKDGYSETYGARPIKRQLQEKVEAPLADYLLKAKPKSGTVIEIGWKEGKPTVMEKKKEKKQWNKNPQK